MKIGILGYTGRVGALLIKELQSGRWPNLQLAGGYARKKPDEDPGFFTTQEPIELFKRSDVVIDFTLPDATRNHIKLAVEQKTGLVIGTTGLDEEDERFLHEAAQETRIVYAANMSVGISLLLALVEQAAEKLGPAWDIEIFEVHHKHKVDAPSGTALALGRAAAKGRGISQQKNPALDNKREGKTFVFDREGKRIEEEIGFAVSRGGDVVGEHSVTFYTEGERLELGHKASDRSLFAKGALHAAQWLKDKPAGLYSMRDILDL